jgi:hypothetical protein
MIRLTCDGSDVISGHQELRKKIVKGIEETCPKAGEVGVFEIRQDLRGKILRPREGTDSLASNIDYEIVRGPDRTLIGIGNIESLNSRVPYWRVIDEGTVSPINRYVPGFFVDPTGNVVPFDPARGPVVGPSGGGEPTEDIFVYTGSSPAWRKATQYIPGEAPSGSMMYVRKPIAAKHYFDSGAMEAWPKIISLFARAFGMAFR